MVHHKYIDEPWFPVNFPGIQSIEQVFFILSCWLLICAQVYLPLVSTDFWLLLRIWVYLWNGVPPNRLIYSHVPRNGPHTKIILCHYITIISPLYHSRNTISLVCGAWWVWYIPWYHREASHSPTWWNRCRIMCPTVGHRQRATQDDGCVFLPFCGNFF